MAGGSELRQTWMSLEDDGDRPATAQVGRLEKQRAAPEGALSARLPRGGTLASLVGSSAEYHQQFYSDLESLATYFNPG